MWTYKTTKGVSLIYISMHPNLSLGIALERDDGTFSDYEDHNEMPQSEINTRARGMIFD